MTQDVGFGNSDKSLFPAEGSTVGLDTLNDAMDRLQVFPDKTTDTRISGNRLVGTVRELVASLGTFDQDVIDKRLRTMRDLGAEGVSDITLENGGRVRPTHRENGQTESTKRSRKRRQILRILVKLALVKKHI